MNSKIASSIAAIFVSFAGAASAAPATVLTAPIYWDSNFQPCINNSYIKGSSASQVNQIAVKCLNDQEKGVVYSVGKEKKIDAANVMLEIKVKKGNQAPQIYKTYGSSAKCKDGSTANSGDGMCRTQESASDCVERLDYPSRVVLNKAIAACKSVEAQRNKDGLKEMEEIRLKGSAARTILAGIVYKLDPTSIYAVAFDASSGFTWNNWVTKTEAWLTDYYHRIEQKCENHERQNYRDRLIGIKKTCGAPL